MIKVVHIVPDLARGGGQQVAIHLLRGMDRTRFEPIAISLFDRLGYPIEKELEQEGIRVHYLGKHLGLDLRATQRLAKILRELQPGIVHTHLNCLRYALPSIIFIERRPAVIHTVHNLAQYEVGPADRFLYRFAFKHLGVIPIAIADAVQESIRQQYEVPSILIRNGIPHQKYRARHLRKLWRTEHGIDDDDIVILNLGRLCPQKNQTMLIDALARLPKDTGKIHCLIVGEGPLATALKAKVEALPFKNDIHFLGHRADVPLILAAADIGVLSSDWEGNPLCVMEMMSAGIPVIATAVGGVPELLARGGGILIRPGDVTELTRAISRIASDRATRDRMGNIAMQVAEQRFTVEQMVSQYESLYLSQVDLHETPMREEARASS